MRNITVFLIGLILLTSCHFGGRRVRGNGNIITQTRNVGSFNGVRVVGGMDAVVRNGSAPGVTVETDENLQKYILTSVEGNTLVIRPRNGFNISSSDGSKVYITAPAFAEATVSGSGSITSAEKLTTQKLQVHVNGSGDVKLDINAPEVEARTNGSGTITLAGTTRALKVDINGSGDFRCYNLMSETTGVDISGSGSAQVFASKQLDVEIRGSGDVAYKGNPAVRQHLSGSGSVRNVQ